jgi:hypothetical protein
MNPGSKKTSEIKQEFASKVIKSMIETPEVGALLIKALYAYDQSKIKENGILSLLKSQALKMPRMSAGSLGVGKTPERGYFDYECQKLQRLASKGYGETLEAADKQAKVKAWIDQLSGIVTQFNPKEIGQLEQLMNSCNQSDAIQLDDMSRLMAVLLPMLDVKKEKHNLTGEKNAIGFEVKGLTIKILETYDADQKIREAFKKRTRATVKPQASPVEDSTSAGRQERQEPTEDSLEKLKKIINARLRTKTWSEWMGRGSEHSQQGRNARATLIESDFRKLNEKNKQAVLKKIDDHPGQKTLARMQKIIQAQLREQGNRSDKESPQRGNSGQKARTRGHRNTE